MPRVPHKSRMLCSYLGKSSSVGTAWNGGFVIAGSGLLRGRIPYSGSWGAPVPPTPLAAQNPQRSQQRPWIGLQCGTNHRHAGRARAQTGRRIAGTHRPQPEPRLLRERRACAFQGRHTERRAPLPGVENGRQQQRIELRLDRSPGIVSTAGEQHVRTQVATRVSRTEPSLGQMKGVSAQGAREIRALGNSETLPSARRKLGQALCQGQALADRQCVVAQDEQHLTGLRAFRKRAETLEHQRRSHARRVGKGDQARYGPSHARAVECRQTAAMRPRWRAARPAYPRTNPRYQQNDTRSAPDITRGAIRAATMPRSQTRASSRARDGGETNAQRAPGATRGRRRRARARAYRWRRSRLRARPRYVSIRRRR